MGLHLEEKKKGNLGESKELGLPVCTAAVSPSVVLQGQLPRPVLDVVHDLAAHRNLPPRARGPVSPPVRPCQGVCPERCVLHQSPERERRREGVGAIMK